MPQTCVQKLDGGENLEGNFERDQTTQLWFEPQNLPRLTKKKNDEKTSSFGF